MKIVAKALSKATAKNAPNVAPPNQIENPSQVEFFYKFADSYSPIYANGVIGGVGTQGEIVLNFYVERHALPLVERHAITANGGLGAMIGREPAIEGGKVPVVRCVNNGTIISLDVAKRIHKFLGDRILELEKAKVKAKKT